MKDTRLDKIFNYGIGCFGLVGVLATAITLLLALVRPAQVITVIEKVSGISPTPVTIVETSEINSTHTPYPTYTPFATYTPYPTYTKLLPTHTPLPTNTSPPSTAAPRPQPTPTPEPTEDSRLEVGETWTQDDVSLTLDDVVLTLERGNWDGQIGVSFTFENHLTQDLIFSISKENFIYTDNLGNRGNSTGWGWACYGKTWQVIVPPSSTLRTIDCTPHGTISEVYNERLLWFKADITDQSITEITITVKEFSRIKNARWRIPIPH